MTNGDGSGDRRSTAINWLGSNWIWLALGVGALALFVFGRGGCGMGHGGHDHRQQDEGDHDSRPRETTSGPAEERARLPQIACFDTAFHETLPRLARMTGLPRDVAGNDIRRYGFHGLSYEFIVDELRRTHGAAVDDERVIVAHLGNGASMAAIKRGRSVETTMGFSTLAGLPMGTRCGDLDPGIVLYLLMEKGLSAEAVQHILYERSGLVGISGASSDMRELLGQKHRPEVAEAIDYFCARARAYIGSLTATLGGVDRLVFTGGIGANAPEIRARICDGLGFLGVDLDPERNRSGARAISRDASTVRVEAFATDEESMIARHTVALIAPRAIPREA